MENTRPLTDAERRYLDWWLKGKKLSLSLKDRAVGSCFASGCLTLVIYALLAAACKIFGFTMGGKWGATLLIPPAVLWLICLTASFGMKSRPDSTAEARKRIQADLAGGVARLHRFRATEVVMAYRDQRRERTYFVRLDDGKILFLAPWKYWGYEDSEMSFVPDGHGFPSGDFEIAATPNDLLILDVVGRGDFLRPADEFELNDDPDLSKPPRLESACFIDVPWEKIRKEFG
jgi:hypothetical protein